MITAKELQDVSNSIGILKIPDTVLEYMIEQAKLGLYSVTLAPYADLGVDCLLNSNAEEQHAKLTKLQKCFESYGYKVEFLYPYSDDRLPIDGVIVSW